MAAVVKPGTLVSQYKIIELAGDGTQSNIYLAEYGPQMHWLIQIEAPDWEPDVSYAQVERLTLNGGQWMALPAAGTGMVHLASWVDRLELPFIGWRWANLGREVGLLHSKGVILQNTRPLSLDRLEFTRTGELSLMQGTAEQADQYTFPAPDAPDAVNASSDVFALGAALQALAGDKLPRGVQSVIQRATNPDASKRYPNGTAFAEALGGALPDPQREKVAPPRPKKNIWQWIAIAGLFVCLGVALCVGLAYMLGMWLVQDIVAVPTVVQAERLRVTILDWEMLEGCQAQARVTVQDKDGLVAAQDGVLYFAVTPLANIGEIESATAADAAATELRFSADDFCDKGGALTIGARREDREGKSTVYYYPPDEDIPENVTLFKPGGSQVRLNKFSTNYMNFGLAGPSGGPANLKGSIKIKLLQDGIEVPDPRLKAVNGELDPLVAVLVLDTSKSMTGDALAKSQLAALRFIDKLQPKDYVCVYRFATRVSEAHICSTNKKTASEAITQLTAGGNTSLYDVLAEVGKRHANRADRQVIILLSDGADNNSSTPRDQALNSIAKTNVPVYAVGLRNQDLAPAVLQEIATRTGGEYMEAPRPDDLAGLYDALQARFANQYEVAFESVSPERERGTLELIISDGEGEITIKKDYYAGP